MPKRRELFIVKQSKANQRKSRMMKNYEWFNSVAPIIPMQSQPMQNTQQPVMNTYKGTTAYLEPANNQSGFQVVEEQKSTIV